MTWPSEFLAARPMVWMREVSDLRKPSLSASRMATREISGMSRPSRRIQTHVADDLGPLEGVDVRVEVFDADARLRQVIGQVLGHFFRQGRDQNFVFVFGLPADLTDEVVDLSLDGADIDPGIQEAGRADDLLGAEQLVFLLIGARSR